MSHADAALTPFRRLKLARLIVEDGWSVARVAERFQVSWPTAKRWADRYRELRPAGMKDRRDDLFTQLVAMSLGRRPILRMPKCCMRRLA